MLQIISLIITLNLFGFIFGIVDGIVCLLNKDFYLGTLLLLLGILSLGNMVFIFKTNKQVIE
jgi:hypothetical protein